MTDPAETLVAAMFAGVTVGITMRLLWLARDSFGRR